MTNVLVWVTPQPIRAPPTFQAWRSARMGNDWHPAARMEQSGFGRLAIENNNQRPVRCYHVGKEKTLQVL